MDSSPYLNESECEAESKLSRTERWRLRQREVDPFPEPVTLTGRRKVWIKQEVRAWMVRQINRARKSAMALAVLATGIVTTLPWFAERIQ